jgi:peptide/nickel transport system ATP-binding protein
MDQRRLADHRGRNVAMIFQEPMLAFDPVFTVGDQIAETVRRHEGLDRAAARRRALEMLERVRIPGAARRLDAYPHEMSGGMRQRAMIALGRVCCSPTSPPPPSTPRSRSRSCCCCASCSASSGWR